MAQLVLEITGDGEGGLKAIQSYEKAQARLADGARSAGKEGAGAMDMFAGSLVRMLGPIATVTAAVDALRSILKMVRDEQKEVQQTAQTVGASLLSVSAATGFDAGQLQKSMLAQPASKKTYLAATHAIAAGAGGKLSQAQVEPLAGFVAGAEEMGYAPATMGPLAGALGRYQPGAPAETLERQMLTIAGTPGAGGLGDMSAAIGHLQAGGVPAEEGLPFMMAFAQSGVPAKGLTAFAEKIAEAERRRPGSGLAEFRRAAGDPRFAAKLSGGEKIGLAFAGMPAAQKRYAAGMAVPAAEQLAARRAGLPSLAAQAAGVMEIKEAEAGRAAGEAAEIGPQSVEELQRARALLHRQHGRSAFFRWQDKPGYLSDIGEAISGEKKQAEYEAERLRKFYVGYGGRPEATLPEILEEIKAGNQDQRQFSAPRPVPVRPSSNEGAPRQRPGLSGR